MHAPFAQHHPPVFIPTAAKGNLFKQALIYLCFIIIIWSTWFIFTSVNCSILKDSRVVTQL